MKRIAFFFLLSLISYKGFSQEGAIFFRIFTCPSPKGNGFEWYIKNAGTQPAPCAVVKKVIWGKDSASIHFDSDTIFIGSCTDAKTQSVPARVAMFDNGKLVACIPPWGTGGGSGTVTSVSTGLGLSGGTITTTGTLLVDTSSASILSRQRAVNTYYPLTNPSGYTSNTGTVTSVATGYGLSGSTISTTGTLLVDSATLSAKYKRQTDSTNTVTGYTTLYQNSLKAPLASPTLTGTVTVPTPSNGTDAANKTYVDGRKRVSIQFSSIALGAPVDATNYYYGSYPGLAPTTTAGARGFVIPTACTITAASLSIIFTGTNPTSEPVFFYIRRANTTDYTISTTVNMSVGTNVPIYVVATGLSVPINGTASDFIEIKMTTPAWVTNPTNVFVSGVLYGTE